MTCCLNFSRAECDGLRETAPQREATGGMIEWRDTAICLGSRPHGESAVILDVFTPNQGRHSGMVRGGAGRKMGPILQPGAQLDVVWKARLDDHLGAFTVEPVRSRMAQALAHRVALHGVSAVTETLRVVLAERDPHPRLYRATEGLLDLLDQPDLWPLGYLRWEMLLLEVLGFGLDLDRCVTSGSTEDLVYISPKSGRAVSRLAAGDWADRLLPMVPCLRGADGENADVAAALDVTGYFLAKNGTVEGKLPEARARFLAVLRSSGGV